MSIGALKQRIVDSRLFDGLRIRHEQSEYNHWIGIGKPVPPPAAFKHRLLRRYARHFSPKVFVETGTYLGDTVFVLRDIFPRMYSIELSLPLAARARERFARRRSISILVGDSAAVLPSVLSEITERALFWLDGHYSGGITAKGARETPVVQELRCILDHRVSDHVILIDDARLFVGEHDYPALDDLREIVRAAGRDQIVDVRDDIIRIHRPPTLAGEY